MRFLNPTVFMRLAIVLLISAFLAGCAQVFPSAQGLEVVPPTPIIPTATPRPLTNPTEETEPTAEPENTIAPTEATVEETALPLTEPANPQNTVITATLPTEIPTEAPALNTVLGNSELVATDPASFNPASGKVQVVEFFAFWCHVCRAMAPLVHGLEDKYKGRVNFVYLDIDDDKTEALRLTFQFYYQPHIFLLDAEGNILQQWIGYIRQSELEAALISALE